MLNIFGYLTCQHNILVLACSSSNVSAATFWYIPKSEYSNLYLLFEVFNISEWTVTLDCHSVLTFQTINWKNNNKKLQFDLSILSMAVKIFIRQGHGYPKKGVKDLF